MPQGKLDKKSKLIGVLYPGNPSHMQGYTKAEIKRMEEIYQANEEQKKKQKL